MTAETDLLPMPKGEAVGMYQAWSYDQMHAYARANVAHATAALQAENERLLAERDALARENAAMKRCATKYLEWLGVTHTPLDQALYDDMRNPGMCGDAAMTVKEMSRE